MHNFTQTKTTTANQLVLYHECVSQNELQQLQADVVMYWDCFETAAFVLQFTFVLKELTNPTQLYVSFLCLAWCTKWLIMYEPNVVVLDTNSTVVSKTIVGFETPRKRLWHTRFLWFSLNIVLYINIQNILSVGVFLFFKFYVWIKTSQQHMKTDIYPELALNTEVGFFHILTAGPPRYIYWRSET